MKKLTLQFDDMFWANRDTNYLFMPKKAANRIPSCSCLEDALETVKCASEKSGSTRLRADDVQHNLQK